MDSDDKAIICIICTVIFSVFATASTIFTVHSNKSRNIATACIAQGIKPEICSKY